jgi:hypothetical protein
MAPAFRLNLPATRLTPLPGWLISPAARSVPPALWLTPSAARLAGLAVWLIHATARLAGLAVWLDEPTAPINHLSIRLNRPAMPVNRPAARFFAKNTPKPVKTASFPRPAPPTAQKATVAAGATANRASVLDCGSPLPLWRPRHARKRQRAAALQNLTAKPAPILRSSTHH